MKDAITKIKDINLVIKELDPALKEKARDILFEIAFGEGVSALREHTATAKQLSAPAKGSARSPASDPSSFFASFDHKAPKDNVNLLAAWLYSQYGTYPISPKDIKEVASSVGLVIPTRCDNTMRQAKKNGKSLYRQNGKGWEPTVNGELFFKETYSVTKGNKPRNEAT